MKTVGYIAIYVDHIKQRLNRLYFYFQCIRSISPEMSNIQIRNIFDSIVEVARLYLSYSIGYDTISQVLCLITYFQVTFYLCIRIDFFSEKPILDNPKPFLF